MATDICNGASSTTSSATHIWQEDPVSNADGVIYGAKIEFPDGTSERLWYKVPTKFSSYVSDSCDSFLTGTLLRAAQHPAPVHVHGRISPSLLKNLVEFQAAFHSWYSNTHNFTPIEITADQESEDVSASTKETAIGCFSGGFDSGFTFYRHLIDPERGRFSRNIQAGLFVLGGDIPLIEELAFSNLIADYQKLLEGIGTELMTVRSNVRGLNDDWPQGHGLAIASQLMLFKKRFNSGIIASTDEYSDLITPWGSHPITDPLLSSSSFEIVHDGCGFTRSQKVAAVAKWNDLYKQIRVCFSGPDYTRNCGRCWKCTLAWLCVQLAGAPQSEALPAPTVDSILKLRRIPSASLRRAHHVTRHPQWEERVPRDIRKAVSRFITHQNRQHLLQKKFPGDSLSSPGVLLSKIHKHIGIYIT